MKRILVALTLIVVAVALMLVSVPAPSAHAQQISSKQVVQNHAKPLINTVPCNNFDFFEMDGGSGEICLANDGYTGIIFSGMNHLNGGNNWGWIKCYGGSLCSSGGTYYHFQVHTDYYFGGAYVTQVDIEGQA